MRKPLGISFLALALIVSSAPPARGELKFEHHFIDRDLPGDSYGQTCLVDIDQDGDLDFITGGKDRQKSIYWFEFQGPDKWARHLLGTNHPSDVGGAAVDVDGDGWIDHVTGGVWYRNPGNPRSESFKRIAFDPELNAVHDVVASDLNGDGKPEIITMSDKNNLRWYGIPADPGQAWERHDVGGGVHAGVAAGDIDGDGDNDIARSNVWFENADGKGTKWNEHRIPFGNPNQPYPFGTRCVIIDINQDGHNDLVMTENEIRAGKIAWLENQGGKGTEWEVHLLEASDSDARGAYHSLAVADFDDDGDPDVFTVEMEAIPGARQPRWFIWENTDGKGARFVERTILDNGLGSHEAVVADVDGDGDVDICGKLWRPRKDNANQGRNHADFLENLLVKQSAARNLHNPEKLLAELRPFFKSHCYDCHDSAMEEGGLNLEALSLQARDRENFERWVLIHDRVQNGEMPPKKKTRPERQQLTAFLNTISNHLAKVDHERADEFGRAKIRRLNRFEYENSLRHALAAPWLQVADMLPEDGTVHLFNKSSEQLDVSHVQMLQYLEAADYALRMAVQAAAHPATTNRFYAREERVMQNYLRYRFGQMAATRAAIPLIGTTPEPDVIRKLKPITVGESDPEVREQEAMGFVSGTYSATTKYDFTRMDLPVDGRYRIRMKTYTFLAGPNGASGGDDHGLTGGKTAWWRPSRTVAFPGTRSEPITLYALADSGDSRWLTTFDSLPEPAVVEREVFLKKGEKIRPDAARLVRTRPGWKGNPNATTNGVPGFAMNWLEIEGPLHDEWPPASYRAVFGDLPFEVSDQQRVTVISETPEEDARRLLLDFLPRIYRQRNVHGTRVEPFVQIYRKARALGEDFTDAMLAAFTSALCSTEFLYLESAPGPLSQEALAWRLSCFLWNGPPDNTLLCASDLTNGPVLREQTERLLQDPRSARFINAFLDYWLDLREIQANAPDAELYPDYYLDELLTESSVLETRRFFRELIEKDLPARNLVHSDFAFVNESLALHYGLPPSEGVELRRIALPPHSPRGGLITQASVLRVTANGTTTSPVIRGAWIMERLLGLHIPPPPSGVAAIEPDIRGAKTIREQLDKHRAESSCNACHAKFDPPGFALENFDVAGGWRQYYRAVGDEGAPVEGIGKNGHEFKFRLAQPIDPAGELRDGRKFHDIFELKEHLANDERAIARNLAHQFIVYATGAPVSFADRAEVESILKQCATEEFGVRSLIHGVVQSRIFRHK